MCILSFDYFWRDLLLTRFLSKYYCFYNKALYGIWVFIAQYYHAVYIYIYGINSSEVYSVVLSCSLQSYALPVNGCGLNQYNVVHAAITEIENISQYLSFVFFSCA